MPKRLVLFLDGTWNDDWNPRVTNIVRMREILSDSLSVNPPADAVAREKQVYGKTDAIGTEHIVYYHRGVGTGFMLQDIFGGGAFGHGLTSNVREAYKFISFYYEPGDEIYIFGFSRGAFTARSVVGYIATAGLLLRKFCTPDKEALAWSYYRTPPADRFPGIFEELTLCVHDRQSTRVTCLGVFDTVGALGVPLVVASRANRQRFEFHDVELTSVSDLNLHAVAIDERRGPFQPTLWFKPKFKHFAVPVTEQVWFSGYHGDIGGGQVLRDGRPMADDIGSDDISLDWMIKRVRAQTSLPLDLGKWKAVPSGGAFSARRYPLHDSLSLVYWPLRRKVRRINDTRPQLGIWNAYPEEQPYSETIGEMLHISALERLASKEVCYAPDTALACLEIIRATYSDEGQGRDKAILVVDWDGEPLAPGPGNKRVAELLERAAQK